ncbi:MAG: ABC transporter substrate-binding protein [Candidatus Latescibacterota bacterium]|nr:ABC transporter substrate-binding protein [Candidatus Latescibacterota bacterium]
MPSVDRRRPATLAVFGALAMSLWLACNSKLPEGEEIGEIRLALNWFPEAEHGGYYGAAVHGEFESRSLNMKILGGGPDAPVIQRVAGGSVHFGITNADGVINARAAGAPVVALLAPYQVNPRCIMVHESSGIEHIDEIANLTLALSQRPAFSHYLRWKLEFPGVTFVPYHGSVAPFLRDSLYAQQGYVFSEPVIARRQGTQPRALLVSETGFNPYASVLVTTQEILRSQPKLVREVVVASLRGWERYLDTPEPINQYIHSLNPEMDMEILSEGARQSVALVLSGDALESGLGTMTRSRWDNLLRQMEEAGIVAPGQVAPEACFTLEFLP